MSHDPDIEQLKKQQDRLSKDHGHVRWTDAEKQADGSYRVSASQEKLEQRAHFYLYGLLDPESWKAIVNPNRNIDKMLANFARAELQKAAEIVEQSYNSKKAVEEIRKLME